MESPFSFLHRGAVEAEHIDPGETLAVACNRSGSEKVMVRKPVVAGGLLRAAMVGATVVAALLLPFLPAVAPAAEEEPALEPGASFRDCAACPEMVVVPAGSFRMGDLTGGGDADEDPVREVAIARPFAIAKYETTFAEWDTCVAAGGCAPGAGDVGFGRGRRPAVNVSPEEAGAFAAWVSGLTGIRYRLPSEAEWEYSARAGSDTRYPLGKRCRAQPGELRRLRQRLGRCADRASRLIPRQCLRHPRHGRQRLRVGGGLRARNLRGRPIRRLGVEYR